MPPCGDVALYGASSNQRVYLMSTDSNSVHDDTSNDARTGQLGSITELCKRHDSERYLSMCHCLKVSHLVTWRGWGKHACRCTNGHRPPTKSGLGVELSILE